MGVTSQSFEAEDLNLQATSCFSAFRVGDENQWVTPEESAGGGFAVSCRVCIDTDVGCPRGGTPRHPPLAHAHRDFIVSQMCRKHRAGEDSCASLGDANPTLGRFPLARGHLVPLLPQPLLLSAS